MMNILRASVIAALAVLIGVEVSDADETCQNPLVNGPPIWPPHIMRSPEGELEGPVLDMIDHVIAPVVGKPEIDLNKPWKRVIKEIQTGEIEIGLALLHSDERAKTLSFTKPWQYDRYGIVVNRNSKLVFQGLDSLQEIYGGYLAGINLPEPYFSFIQDNPKVREIPKISSMYKVLESNRLDYLIVSVDAFYRLFPEDIDLASIEALESSFSYVGVHMAVAKDTPCAAFIDKFNERIERYRERKHLSAAPLTVPIR